MFTQKKKKQKKLKSKKIDWKTIITFAGLVVNLIAEIVKKF